MAKSPAPNTTSEQATTGHEWDGIREFDRPLPRWWLWTFYACILFAIGYWILMPSWPLIGGYTKGLLGYSQRNGVAQAMKAAAGHAGQYCGPIAAQPLDKLQSRPGSAHFALAGGRSAFAVNCSQCHGQGAEGSKGFPNLNDDDWLWGGTLDAIYKTIRFGARSGNPNAHESQMPAFLKDGILKPEQINDLAEYVLSFSHRSTDAAAAARGKALFAQNCAACHGPQGKGNPDFGAPNLTDAIWLYGGDKQTIVETISYARRGVMPAWEGRLSPATIKELAIYVHSLGGGK